MKFEHPDYGWFTVVDRPTVRQILTYKGTAGAAVGVDGVDYNRFWKGVKGLVDEWNCKHISDYRTFDPDKSESFEAGYVIIWACVQVAQFMTDLEMAEKNS